jgi:DNA-binding HxlR family transcriptional regulator
VKTVVYIDSFSSGIDDMRRADQRDIAKVLRVLADQKPKRFSVFEASDNMTIARTMTRIVHEGYITTDHSCGYPWTEYELTDKGRAALEAKQ